MDWEAISDSIRIDIFKMQMVKLYLDEHRKNSSASKLFTVLELELEKMIPFTALEDLQLDCQWHLAEVY